MPAAVWGFVDWQGVEASCCMLCCPQCPAFVLCAVQPSPVPHLARLGGLAWFLAHPSPCTLFERHVGLSHTCVVALPRGVSLLLFAPILHHPPRGLTLPPLCPQPTSSPVQKPRLPVAKAKPKKAKGLFS